MLLQVAPHIPGSRAASVVSVNTTDDPIHQGSLLSYRNKRSAAGTTSAELHHHHHTKQRLEGKMDEQSKHHSESLRAPADFWHAHAQKLSWETQYSTPLRVDGKRKWRWFPDGRISATYNLVTRHVLSGRGEERAVIWDSPVTGRKRVITYAELQEELEVFAEVLRGRGIKEGDTVLVYSLFSPPPLFCGGFVC